MTKKLKIFFLTLKANRLRRKADNIQSKLEKEFRVQVLLTSLVLYHNNCPVATFNNDEKIDVITERYFSILSMMKENSRYFETLRKYFDLKTTIKNLKDYGK